MLDACGRAVKVGATTDDIDRVCHEASVERDCYPSPLNYHEFPKSCCTSVNEVICHGIPDGYTLKDGDIVNGMWERKGRRAVISSRMGPR